MSLSAKQIAALDAWSKTQEPGAYGQTDGNPANDLNAMGTLFDSGKMLNDNLRDEYISTVVTLTAPTGSTITTNLVAFVAPTAGTLQSVQLVTPVAWATSVTTTVSNYTIAVRKYNNSVSANITLAYDMQTGLASGTLATLPTNQSNTALALISATSNTVSLGASSANFTLTVTVALLNAPTVNDYVAIGIGATNLAGATVQNAGIYQITAVDPAGLWLTATKLFGANPQTVAHVTAAAGDNTAVKLIRAGNALIAAGDMIGFQVIEAATAVDLSANPLTFLIRFRPA